jgi:hypothetical protein
MNTKRKFVVLFLLIALIAVLVLRNVQSHAPVQPGTPADFWNIACGIDVDGSANDQYAFGGIYPPQGPWAIYYIQGYHDQFLHCVPLSDLTGNLAKISLELKRQANSGDIRPWLQNVAATWTPQSNDVQEIRRLLAQIEQDYLNYKKSDDDKSYALRVDDEHEFQIRWQRANRYWLSIFFEFGWLAFVALFALFPWIRNSNRLAWAADLGLAVPLLFLPFFLGYVPYTFTSAFPAGGIFYPYVIGHFRGLPLFKADLWLLEHAPQPFEPLTQEPGPMIALTGMGLVGPIAVSAIGAAVFASAFAISAAGRFLRDKLHRAHSTQ